MSIEDIDAATRDNTTPPTRSIGGAREPASTRGQAAGADAGVEEPEGPSGAVKGEALAATREAGAAASADAERSGGAPPPAPIGRPGRRALAPFWEGVAELRRRHATEAPDEADARQLEELGALEAIFGDALQLLAASPGGPRVLRLELPAEAPGGDGGVALLVGTGDGDVVVGHVMALPPVALLCALPGSYPLEGAPPPVLALDAEHLGTGCLAELEAELRALAEAHAGEPALFDLATALQAGLQPPPQLSLGAEGSGAMEVAIRLLAYDRRVRDEKRQREVHACPVCLDSVLGSRGLFLACDHFACSSCLERMVRIHVSEGDAEALCCPVPDCRRPFGPDVLREVAGSDPGALARWEDLALRRCLEGMRDVVFCPRCDLDGDGQRSPCIEDEDRMARCGACGFVFCGRCRGVYHPGAECSSAEDRMEALEARARGRGPGAAAAREELLTLRHLARTTKPCPRCGAAIEKSGGCSKVRCGSCGAYLCWRCGKEIGGYDHFATSECRLFDDEEVRRWNQQMHAIDRAQARAHEARFLAQFVDPAQLWQQARECPRCRSVVIREGRNNHLRCHACQTHFCGRCLVVLQKGRVSDHFGKSRACPQHSDD